jgi:hypothetical protein
MELHASTSLFLAGRSLLSESESVDEPEEPFDDEANARCGETKMRKTEWLRIRAEARTTCGTAE